MATILSTLYPPLVDTFMPAFINTESAYIKFSISSYNSKKDIKYLHVSLVNQKTNIKALVANNAAVGSEGLNRDDVTIQDGVAIYRMDSNLISYNKETELYTVRIPPSWLRSPVTTTDGSMAFSVEGFYKAQIRFDENFEINPFSSNDYLITGRTFFSEWSSVCLLKAIPKPTIELKQFADGAIPTFNQGLIPIVGQVLFSSENLTGKEAETVRSYQISIFNKENPSFVLDSTDVIFTANSADPNQIYWLADGENETAPIDQEYTVEITVTTKNQYQFIESFTFILADFLGYEDFQPEFTFKKAALLSYELEEGKDIPDPDKNLVKIITEEDGIVNFNVTLKIPMPPGYLYIKRSRKENGEFKHWELLSCTEEANAVSRDFSDMTVCSLEEYAYSAQYQMKDSGLFTKSVIAKETIYPDFYDMFLSRDGVQFAIRHDGKINSLQPVVNRQKIDTLGGKYPRFAENAQMNYKQFNITGYIDAESDFNRKFLSDVSEEYRAAIKNYNTHMDGKYIVRNDTIADGERTYLQSGDPYLSKFANSTLHDLYPKDNWWWQREFREQALKWLNDGEPKLFRSMPEGNMTVMLTDISLTPNTTVNRRLYTFSATMYEIEDGHSLDTLASLGIISVPNEKITDNIDKDESEEDETQDTISTIGQVFSQEINGDWEVVNNTGHPTGQGEKGFNYSRLTIADKAYYMDYESGSVLGQRYQAVPDSIKLKDVRLEFETPPRWYYFKGDKISLADTEEQEYRISYPLITEEQTEKGWFKKDITYYQLTNNNSYRIVSEAAQNQVQKNPQSAGYCEEKDGYVQWTNATDEVSKENLSVLSDNGYEPLSNFSLFTREDNYIEATEHQSNTEYYIINDDGKYEGARWLTLGSRGYFEKNDVYTKVSEAPNENNNIPQPWEGNDNGNWYRNISESTVPNYEKITPETKNIPFQKNLIATKALFTDGYLDSEETYYSKDKENGITVYREVPLESLNVLKYAFEKTEYKEIDDKIANPDPLETYYHYNAETEKYEEILPEDVPGLSENIKIYYLTYKPVENTEEYKWDTVYYLRDDDSNYIPVDITNYYCEEEYREVAWNEQIINTEEPYYKKQGDKYVEIDEKDYKTNFFYEDQMRQSDNYDYKVDDPDTVYYTRDKETGEYIITDVFDDYIYEIMKVRSADNIETIKQNLKVKYYKKTLTGEFSPLTYNDFINFYKTEYTPVTEVTIDNIKARSGQGESFYTTELVYIPLTSEEKEKVDIIETIYEESYVSIQEALSLEDIVENLDSGIEYWIQSATGQYEKLMIENLTNDFSKTLFILKYVATQDTKETIKTEIDKTENGKKYYYQDNNYNLLSDDFIQNLNSDTDITFYTAALVMVQDVYEKKTDKLYLKTDDSLNTIKTKLAAKKKYYKYNADDNSYEELTLENMGEGGNWGIQPDAFYQKRYHPITKDILTPKDLETAIYYWYSTENESWEIVTKNDLPQYYIINKPSLTELYPYQSYTKANEDSLEYLNSDIEGYVVKVEDSSADISNPDQVDDDYHYEEINTTNWWTGSENIYFYIQSTYDKSEDYLQEKGKVYYAQNEDNYSLVTKIDTPTYYQKDGFEYSEATEPLSPEIEYYYKENEIYKKLPPIYIHGVNYFITEDTIWDEHKAYYKNNGEGFDKVETFSIVDLNKYFIQKREEISSGSESDYPHALGYKLTLTIPNPKPTEDNNKPLTLNIFVNEKGYYQIPSNLDVLNIKLYDDAVATINYKITYNTAYNTEKIPTKIDLTKDIVGQVSGWWTAQTNISNLVYQKYKEEIYNPDNNVLQAYVRFSDWNSLSFDVTPYAVFGIQYFNTSDFESYVVGRTGRFNLLRNTYNISALRFLGRRMVLASGHKPIDLDEWEFVLDDSAKTDDDEQNSNLTWNEFINQSVIESNNLVDISIDENSENEQHYTTTSLEEGINRLWNNNTNEQISALGGYTSIAAIKHPKYNTVYGVRNSAGEISYVIYYLDENWYPVIFNDKTTILAKVPISGMINYKGKVVTTSYD